MFFRKINNIPEFYMIFARKMPELPEKYFFPNFRWHVPPCPPCPMPPYGVRRKGLMIGVAVTSTISLLYNYRWHERLAKSVHRRSQLRVALPDVSDILRDLTTNMWCVLFFCLLKDFAYFASSLCVLSSGSALILCSETRRRRVLIIAVDLLLLLLLLLHV